LAGERELLLDVKNLQIHFRTEQGIVRAVDDVSFQVYTGETLGVVGESGCGKTVTALSILQMVAKPRGQIVGGSITYYGQDTGPVEITTLEPDSAEMRSLRGAHISMIFQEPMTSLTPVYTIGQQISESLIFHQKLTKKQAKARAIDLLGKVGIAAPQQRVDEYPHQLSGGMRQRAMIALALACDPKLLIADEPTTALDVTIQAQILELLLELQEELGMSILIITHDLGVIGELADRVMVMYMGKSVETASCHELFYKTRHPYTKALLNSIPKIGVRQRLTTIPGSVPSPYSLPRGCYFRPRCEKAHDACFVEPPLILTEPDHEVKCWLYVKEDGK